MALKVLPHSENDREPLVGIAFVRAKGGDYEILPYENREERDKDFLAALETGTLWLPLSFGPDGKEVFGFAPMMTIGKVELAESADFQR